jgi:hypothetical protein
LLVLGCLHVHDALLLADVVVARSCFVTNSYPSMESLPFSQRSYVCDSHTTFSVLVLIHVCLVWHP